MTHGMMEDTPPQRVPALVKRVEPTPVRVLFVTIRVSAKLPEASYLELMRSLEESRIRDAVMLAVPCDLAAYVDVEVA